jgi:hypothetical protein
VGSELEMRYVLILLLIVVFSCSKEHDRQLYIGELYFSPFRIGSFYNLDDSMKFRVEQTMDTSRLDKADSASRLTIELYRKFKTNGLLYKPFIDLRLNDSSFVKLYMDSLDYDRIKIYKRQDLVDKNKKIVIWGRTKELGRLDFPLLYCTELIDVELADGQTFPQKQGKFRVDDYE